MNAEPTIIGLLLAGMAVLSGVVGKLWRMLVVHYEEMRKKLDDCEEDRSSLWRAMADNQGGDANELRERYRNAAEG